MPNRALSLVFVHGFRGDHTSFQSFPADLHLHLSSLIPGLHTFVYPTYKTKRPLEVARDDFLTWIRMKNLPEGGVILCGHSMGGLLTAEVALAAPPGRVVGLVSFDVPYLGVHPRVVLSGIASLFKKKEELAGYRTSGTAGRHEASGELYAQVPLNTRPVGHPESSPDTPVIPPSTTPSTTNLPSLHLSVPIPPIRVIAPKTERLFRILGLGPVPQSVHNFLHFWDKHPGVIGLKDGIVQIFEFGGCLLNPQGLISRYERLQQWSSDGEAGPYGRGWVNLWTTPVPQGHITTEERAGNHFHSPRLRSQSRLSHLSPTPSESSFNSSSFQSSLFQTLSYNPSLSTTVTSLESVHFSADHESTAAASPSRLQARLPSKVLSPDERVTLQPEDKELATGLQKMGKEKKRLEGESKARVKKAEKERTMFLKAVLKRREQEDGRDPPHNFIVLPKRGTDHQWIRVPVVGAEDEIVAHCGLFFRDENPGYQQLIADVGNIVRGFWDGKGGLRHSRSTI
ncbi:unnamed protein product [Rhizoctonia solani]|uniref:AB hydrolase-1 domain-containing protein n=1 Tax=Rhizoctonia solani TaxID=456999 RepID=A0A8H3GB36_9AGAM|nr:unnamed protein product [Rhizoctonia solani]